MTKRIISSLIGLPILIMVVVLGENILKAAMFALIVIGMSEVYKALSGSYKKIHLVGYIFTAAYMIFIDYVSDYKVTTILFILFTLVTLSLIVICYDKIGIIDVCITIFGFYYVAILLSSVYLVREFRFGAYFVWIIFIAAWGCDTGAYFVGKLFGRHKLTKKLSPSKTVEGAIGGTVFATILSLIYGFIIYKLNIVDRPNIILYFSVSGAICSVFSQFGDLTASAIKRYTGIKDFGNIIPGHGGIIDRFDSIIFPAPAIYLTQLILFK